MNGWTFYYAGWERSDGKQVRKSTEKDPNETEDETTEPDLESDDIAVFDTNVNTLFPPSRKGCLDYKLLEKLGLTKKRIQHQDFLFFYQLLLPFCEVSKSGV